MEDGRDGGVSKASKSEYQMSTEKNSKDSHFVSQNSRKISLRSQILQKDGDSAWGGWKQRDLKVCLRSSEIPLIHGEVFN